MDCESDIDEQIKKYYDKLEKECPELKILEKELNATFEIIKKGFWNPSNKEPMRVAYLLKFFKDENFVRVMEKFYTHPWKVKYLAPAGKTIIFMVLEKKNPYKTGQHLKADAEDARDLGFEKLPNGKYKVMSGKTLWYNVRKRLGVDGIKELIGVVREEVREVGLKLGIHIGENIGTDPFVVEAVKTDKNAEYNAYYGINGYKCSPTIDIITNIPLVGEVIGINAYEGEKLIAHIQELKNAKMYPKNCWVDGSFTSTENIAKAEICEGVTLHYKIEKDWTFHPEANYEKIKRDYQKYHNEPDFLVGASYDFMQSYLVGKGEYEVVGNMLRNRRMAEYEEAPDSYLDDFHQRNRDESMNNHLENNMDMKKRIRRKGKEIVELAFFLNMLGLLVVAFIKLSQGITTNLVSLDGLG